MSRASNRRATMQQVGTGTTTYTFDAANRLTSIANPFSETTSWVYDAANRCTEQDFANGVVSLFGYDSRNRQTSVTHKNSGGTTLSAESYVYDYAGNLTSNTVDSVETDYTYDAIDQLLSETHTGYSASYTYDGNGNRATKTLGGVTDSYAYDDGDKLTSITEGLTTVKSFTYDAQGRTTGVTTASGTTSLSYDYEDRITGITYPSTATNSFGYNCLDTRVSKTDSSGTATYQRDGVGVTSPLLTDGSSTFTAGVSQRSGSTSTFDCADRLGTYSLETNSSQATTGTRQYDAFGNPTSTTGSPAGPFGFAGGWGYQRDGDSGLKLLGHRYYDPSTGRFLSRDPIRSGGNWYSYCRNNPLRRVDPKGLEDDGNPFKDPMTYVYPVVDGGGTVEGMGGGSEVLRGGAEAVEGTVDLGNGVVQVGGWMKRIQNTEEGDDFGLTNGAVDQWQHQHPVNGQPVIPPNASTKRRSLVTDDDGAHWYWLAWPDNLQMARVLDPI